MASLMDFTVKNDLHLGHVLLSTFKRNPEDICQLDAVTGEKETNASVLSRSIRLARAFRKLGLQPGDVLALSGCNHLDLHIPYYAAFFNGSPICGVDSAYKYDEVKNVFSIILPKIAFCDSESYETFTRVVKDLNLDTTVVHFGKGGNSMKEFVDKYDDDTPAGDFKVAEFDIDRIYIWLCCTSGTTGLAKVAAHKQKQVLDKFKIYLSSIAAITRGKSTAQGRNNLNVAPIHWLTGVFNALALPLLQQCKVQTSSPITTDHLIDIINEYKPSALLTSPALMTSILKSNKQCDFSCFRTITITGSKLRREVYDEVTSQLPEGSHLLDMYGQTESLGPIMTSDPFGPRDAFVMPTTTYDVKLVDPETGKEITAPMVQGELFWSKGPGFTEYYRNPEETKKALTEDGWFKTGDILYRDEAGRFYYVERLKTLIKYRSYHIIPAELEELIREHPGVQDVVVTAIPDDVDSEHPVACVVKQDGADVSAKDIIDLVAGKLSDNKKLRGGVIFLDEIPTTSTGKVALRKLKQIVLQSKREF